MPGVKGLVDALEEFHASHQCRPTGGDRNESPAAMAYDFEPPIVHADGRPRSFVRRLLGRWKDKTLFDRAVNQPEPTPALEQPMGVPDPAPTETGPRPPPQETTRRLELEDERLVVENLPAVRVAEYFETTTP
jgi:hypothetical protein